MTVTNAEWVNLLANVLHSALDALLRRQFVTYHTAVLQTIAFMMTMRKYCPREEHDNTCKTSHQIDLRINYPYYTDLRFQMWHHDTEHREEISINWWKPRPVSQRFIMVVGVDCKELGAVLEKPLTDILTKLEIDAIFQDIHDEFHFDFSDDIFQHIPHSPVLRFTGKFAQQVWTTFAPPPPPPVERRRPQRQRCPYNLRKRPRTNTVI